MANVRLSSQSETSCLGWADGVWEHSVLTWSGWCTSSRVLGYCSRLPWPVWRSQAVDEWWVLCWISVIIWPYLTWPHERPKRIWADGWQGEKAPVLLLHYTSSRCPYCWFLDQTLMWGRAANVLHLSGRRWQELMELSEDDRYRCASLPDVHVGEPLHLLLHVLQEFSWTQQHLTDGADGSLTVIEWHLLLTWEQKDKEREEKMKFIYHHEKNWEICRYY